MDVTQPLVLPDALVREYQIDTAADYKTHWGGWRFMPGDVAFAPDGEMYTLSTVLRYRHDDYDPTVDSSEQAFGCQVVTRYGKDGTPTATTLVPFQMLEGAPVATPFVETESASGLCVLPDGTVALTTNNDGTYLLADQARTLVASYQRLPEVELFNRPLGNSFASAIRVTPSGRLLCTLSEYGVDRRGMLNLNLVAVADAELTSTSRPEVEVIAAADGHPLHQDQKHVRTFAVHQGRPVGDSHRPAPDLGARTSERWPELEWGRPVALSIAEPLGDELFVVPLFGHEYRSGSRGQSFVFALLDDRGELVGRLEGLDLWADSPFTGRRYSVTTDPVRGLAFHSNQYGLYVWNSEGRMLARLSTKDKPFSLLARFRLLRCSPQGELTFVHDKQNLVLRIPVPDDPVELPGVVESALRTFGRQRTALKKELAPVNWHWTFPFEADRVHRV